MKKALSYAVTAILLGTVTMLVPLMLVKPSYIQPSDPLAAFARTPGYCPQIVETLDERGDSLRRAICPPNLSSAGLMLVPSFILALGVSLYFKKRMP